MLTLSPSMVCNTLALASKYATSYCSELKGIKGVMDLSMKRNPDVLNQTRDNKSVVDHVNIPFWNQCDG